LEHYSFFLPRLQRWPNAEAEVTAVAEVTAAVADTPIRAAVDTRTQVVDALTAAAEVTIMVVADTPMREAVAATMAADAAAITADAVDITGAGDIMVAAEASTLASEAPITAVITIRIITLAPVIIQPRLPAAQAITTRMATGCPTQAVRLTKLRASLLDFRTRC